MQIIDAWERYAVTHTPLLRWLTLLLIAIALAAPLAAQTETTKPMVGDKVRQALAQTGEARVIITLGDPVSLKASDADRAMAVNRSQASVLAQLTGSDFQLRHRYTYVPALAGTLSAKALSVLVAHPAVAAIQADEPGQGHLGQSVAALGANLVHANLGFKGEGIGVAVLDSGIDTDHPDLSDDLVAQHCFTQANCLPGNVNESNNAEDQNGHGTNVTGIVSAKGVVSAPGFAPDANVIAIRVLDAENSGWLSDWVAGLDWVRGQAATYNIRIVNMSLGTYALFVGNCDGDLPTVADAIALLNAQGIIVFASAGNQGSNNALGSPACNASVVAVGATYDANLGREPDSGTYQTQFGPGWPNCFDNSTSLQQVTCFSNSNNLLDLLAPGARITGPGLGGGLMTYIGTSQASPTAAGVAALMLQANPNLTPAQVEALLKSTGTLVTDPKNGLQFPLINAWSAVLAALGAPTLTPTPTVTPTATVTPTRTPTASPTVPLVQVSGLVDLQGRSNDSGTRVQVGSYETFTIADGTFVIQVPPGPYQVRVSHPAYLASERLVIVGAFTATEVPPVMLIGGDANINQEVDLFDLVIVGANYSFDVPPADPRGDINGDANVGLVDLTLVGVNYGREGNQPWTASHQKRLAAASDTEIAKSARPVITVELPETVKAGQEFEARLVLRGGQDMAGVDISLAYDPKTMTALGEAKPGDWLTPDRGFVAVNTVDGQAGQVRWVATRLGDDAPTKATHTLLTLRFRAEQTGRPNLSLSQWSYATSNGDVLTPSSP